MPIAEFTLAALPNPMLRYFLATRLPFLSVTLVAAPLGLASAAHAGVALSAATAALTIVFALAAHAGINVLNDYYDDLNGTDRINQERSQRSPFPAICRCWHWPDCSRRRSRFAPRLCS